VGKDIKEFDTKRLSIHENVKRMDLSFNILSSLYGLELFSETLEEIVLDNNQMHYFQLPNTFRKLHTLSLNKNQVIIAKILSVKKLTKFNN